MKTLEVTELHMGNPIWLELRRYLVYIYYDRTLQRQWTMDNFSDFLNDLSLSNGRPEAYGIINQMMMNIPHLKALKEEKVSHLHLLSI